MFSWLPEGIELVYILSNYCLAVNTLSQIIIYSDGRRYAWLKPSSHSFFNEFIEFQKILLCKLAADCHNIV